MRITIMVAAILVAGCGTTASEEREAATSQALSYDGADYASEAEKRAHGERIAAVLGCSGCHNRDLQGGLFAEDFMPGVYASNLTRTVPRMTDEQLDAVIRQGIHPERGDLWLMPSDSFQNLSDEDVVAIIAYLRSVEPAGDETPPPDIPEEAQAQLRQLGFGPATVAIAAARENPPLDLGEEHAFGRHIAITACAECHGFDLTGQPEFSPDLTIAGSYDRTGLVRLLETGEAMEGRDIGLMGAMVEFRFSHMTDHERDAVADYLLARAAAVAAE